MMEAFRKHKHIDTNGPRDNVKVPNIRDHNEPLQLAMIGGCGDI